MTEPEGRDDAPGGPEGTGAPIHVPYELELPGFSGPLELLLHLIRKHKLDILDIPVGFVTEKYLEYIDAMKVINLDVAGEYLEMAATLTNIKSRMLLPANAAEPEEAVAEEQGDPRAELVRRLLEYQKYRDAADQLGALDQLQRDVFARQAERTVGPADRPLAEVGLGALLDAFAAVLKRVRPDLAREVTSERISVAQRIQEIVGLLEVRRRIRFEQFFEGAAGRFDVVVTFLALLEMTKLHMTRLLQAGPDTPLLVDFVGRVDGTADVTSDRVEDEATPAEGPATGETTAETPAEVPATGDAAAAVPPATIAAPDEEPREADDRPKGES
ncbi:MAG: segregation/condensation protein A [Deltaproteobacteria bacterium]|nr:segregation/condensation protein A [Deltaproteobacteria bacterium]